MNIHRSQNTTLVLGGTGKTGRRVAERLRVRGLPFRIGSRSGEPPFDWEDQATWAPALTGVHAVYVTYVPDLAFTGAADRVRAFADLAVELGVRRLVLLSGRNEAGALLGERAVQESGAQWTVVRSSFFAQNFSEYFLLEPVLAGEVAFPAGEVAEPFIDADDIADIAVAALTDDRHVGQLYEVTGPRLLTFAEAVEEISKAAGRRIRYLPISVDEYSSAMLQEGLPPDLVSEFAKLFAEVLDGRNAYLTDGVERALGRPPMDFAEFAQKAAARGVWAAQRAPART